MLLASNGETFAVSEERKKDFFTNVTFCSSYLSNFYHRYFFTFTQVTLLEYILVE